MIAISQNGLGNLVTLDGESVSQLLRYPKLLFFIFVPCFFNNVVIRLFGTKAIWLETLCILLTHSVGFFNFLVYRLHPERKARTESNTQDESYYRAT